MYNTRNIWQDIKKWWGGLSLSMTALCEGLTALRAEISVSNVRPTRERVTDVLIQERCSNAGKSSKSQRTARYEASFKQISSYRGMHAHAGPSRIQSLTPRYSLELIR